MTRGWFRGHEAFWIDDQWFYADTREPVDIEDVRPCKRCGESFDHLEDSSVDLCLGKLPGVDNACCGHGEPSQAYIRFTNGITVRGFDKVEKA